MPSVTKIFKLYIKGTAKGSLVPERTQFLCHLKPPVLKTGFFPSSRVYITTKVLKHLYDNKPAEEFDCVLSYLEQLVQYPEKILENKPGKRGHFCFTKIFKEEEFLASLEISQDHDPEDEKLGTIYIVTAFRPGKERYLGSYKLLWSWKDDNPSS